MSLSGTATALKRIVIIGGGYYGLESAIQCSNISSSSSNENVSVTLIDKREVMNHKVGGIRASIVGNVWADRALVPYTTMFQKSKNKDQHKVIHQSVTRVTADGTIELADGTTIGYDYLIIATGAQNKSPGEVPYTAKTKDEMKTYYETISSKIRAAQNIVICGAGAVGCEYAGEIVDVYGKDSKNITLVTSESALFASNQPPLPPSFGIKVVNQLKQMGVNIIFNDRVVIDKEISTHGILDNITSVQLQSGTTIPADLCIIAVGATTEQTTSIFPKEWIDTTNSKGLLNVSGTKTFQVVNTNNIFAIGDCTNIEETKFAGIAAFAVPTLIANIKSCMKDQVPKKIYPPNTFAFTILPFGEKFGISQFPYGISVGNYITSMLKGKDLFSSKYFQAVNQKAPKVPKNWKETFLSTK